MGWAAEPRAPERYSGFYLRGAKMWNPVDVVNLVQEKVVFHNLAALLKMDVEKRARLVIKPIRLARVILTFRVNATIQ